MAATHDVVQVRRRRLVLGVVAAAVAVAVVVAVIGVGHRGGGGAVRYVPRGELRSDPLAFAAGRTAEFERSAAEGLSQVIYVKSPGGVLAAAARTASFRPLVERATAGTGIDPNLVEAIVLLESAGRPDAIAGGDPAGAAGLTQIVAETASELPRDARRARGEPQLDDVRSSVRVQRGKLAKALRLEAARRAIDARFDPRAGARRDGPLPLDRTGALRPRRSGGRLVPHGYRQPRERAARLRAGTRRRADRSDRPRRRAFLRAGLLRLVAGRPRGRLAPACRRSATTRRPTTGACSPPSRSCASTARTPLGWKRSPTSTNARRAPRRCSTRCPSPSASSHPTTSNAQGGRAGCRRSPTIRG